MSDSWVVQNLQNALNTWNEKLTEVWQLVSQSPESFKGGAIWSAMSLRQQSEAKDGGTGSRSRKEKGHGKKADIVCRKKKYSNTGNYAIL